MMIKTRLAMNGGKISYYYMNDLVGHSLIMVVWH